MEEAPFIGIVRHRIQTDGKGVSTLAAFHGCPLHCRYCLNPQCQREGVWRTFTPESLYEEVKIDQLYFLATGGGITFGGGEPSMYPDFIVRFREICGPEWNLTLETSLNVPADNIRRLSSVINQFIIDIKDTNDEIYRRYTGLSNRRVLDNLQELLKEGRGDDLVVRLPLIKDFNTQEDIERSTEKLRAMGVEHFDFFTYRTDIRK
ncbi:MAG: radical SAM protein [Bacteroidales bacterium]|nr:radical SAM protein [Bacteroidales bacterium]